MPALPLPAALTGVRAKILLAPAIILALTAALGLASLSALSGAADRAAASARRLRRRDAAGFELAARVRRPQLRGDPRRRAAAVAAAAGELARTAEGLEGLVARFRVTAS